jgi:hypothetical protein
MPHTDISFVYEQQQQQQQQQQQLGSGSAEMSYRSNGGLIANNMINMHNMSNLNMASGGGGGGGQQGGMSMGRRQCRHWLRGYCQLGERCGFGHSHQTLGVKRSSDHHGGGGGGGGQPRRLCRHWARGYCQRSNSCSFEHTGRPGSSYGYGRGGGGGGGGGGASVYGLQGGGGDDNRHCRHWAKHNHCQLGDSCDYAHTGASDSRRLAFSN